MPAAMTLSRIGRFDFFAILAPGFCLVVIVVLLVTALMTGPALNSPDAISSLRPLDAIKDVSSLIKDQWPFGLVLFFLAYMAGSILRAIPVNMIDRVCGPLFKWTAARDYDLSLYEEEFPYRPMLQKELEALEKNGLDASLSVPPKKTAHTTFNLWKLMLCDRSPNAFAYSQELEGRVRLFSGMLWGAIAGAVLGAIGFLLSLVGVFNVGWSLVMGGIAVVSILFFGLLGWRLRRVRAEEVQAVFFGIVNLRLKTTDSCGEPQGTESVPHA